MAPTAYPQPLPSGTVTFLFTDIEGSTALQRQLGRERYAALLAAHRNLLRAAFVEHQGREMGTEGDSFFVTFSTAEACLRAATAGQLALVRHAWPEGIGPRVRMGMHTGEPLVQEDNYVALELHEAARVAAAAHGEQLLLTALTAQLVSDRLPEGVSLRSLGSYLLRDFETPVNLFQVEHPELPAEFPALHARRIAPPLPEPATPLVGRQGLQDQLVSLLGSHRVVVLWGPGGVGKTRLALAGAGRCQDRFPDGCWWVPLEDARTTGEMLRRIGVELALEPVEPGSQEAAVAGRLAGRELLLVLDNVEQVEGAAAVVHRLVQLAPAFRCLVTTRVALPLQAAGSLEIPGLPREEAVALFHQSVRRAQPGREFSPAEERAIEMLCLRVDGLPLAIDMLAGWTGTLTPSELLGHLDLDIRCEGLRRQAPDLPARHQTLQAVLEGSLELLGEEQLPMFSRLSVFVGGFFADAAGAVCGPACVPALRALRDASLLQSTIVAGQTRFIMQDWVRAFAIDLLGEGTQERTAAAEHYLRVLQAAVAQLESPRETVALDRVALELPNLRAAYGWAVNSGQDALLARLALGGSEVLRARGWWRERLIWLEQGQKAAGRTEGLSVQEGAALQAALGYAHLDNGDYTQAEALLRAALAQYVEAGDPVGEADCIGRLGHALHQQRRLEEAETLYLEALETSRLLGAAAVQARTLNNMARLAIDRGNLEQARELLEEVLLIDRAAGNARGIAQTLSNLGYLAIQLKDFEGARGFLAESRERAEQQGNLWLLAHVRHNQGTLADDEGDTAAARDGYRAALAIRRELGANEDLAETLIALGELLAVEERWREAGLLLLAAPRFVAGADSVPAAGRETALGKVREALGVEAFGRLERIAASMPLERVLEQALTL